MSSDETRKKGVGDPCRAGRLAEELRANLAKRKAQSRSRRADDDQKSPSGFSLPDSQADETDG